MKGWWEAVEKFFSEKVLCGMEGIKLLRLGKLWRGVGENKMGGDVERG